MRVGWIYALSYGVDWNHGIASKSTIIFKDFGQGVP